MTVFPDGEALSDWEREMLDVIERGLNSAAADWPPSLPGGGPPPFYVLGTGLAAAEAAVALTVLGALTVSACATVGLAMIRASLWVVPRDGSRQIRPSSGRGRGTS
jgi:hypothetical protein